MNNLYDVLELCLQELENGADLESVLARYPEQAEELRPLLAAAVNARTMAVPAPSDEVVRRNRARLLQRAAQKREWAQESNRRFASFQGRWATAFVLFVLVLFSALNVISASALALPGDGLYPVKRWWERVRLSYTFDEAQRETLAGEFESERLKEIEQLLAQGISARVDFVGVVTSQHGDAWRIAKIMVLVTDQTELPDGPLQVGLAVRVYGLTGAGAVTAERIEYLPVNSALPGLSPIFDEHDFTATPPPTATATAPLSAPATPVMTATPSPAPTVTVTLTNAPDNNNVNTNGNDNEASNSNDNGNDNDDVNDDDGNSNDDDNNNNDDNSGSGGGGGDD